jgi:tape measure domain-containing protein
MSATVDDRIVNMQFNNTQFQRGATETMSMLDRLKAKLNFKGSGQGINEAQNAVNRFNMGPISSRIESINAKFLGMATVAATAISNITNRVVNAGLAMGKSFTVQPIIDGFREYETNLGSIQTILANTGLEGERGLGKVEAALAELNHYADDTIYNFSEMARNIGTFTAAGVDLDTSTNAIKGIANLAAVSGSNAQQASTAMYQLSQALAAGKLNLQDWNSVVNAGMGGKVFQDALMETARVHGVAVDQMVKDAGGFRNSITKGWITTDILTETLSKFTGDLSEAQLKQMGYSEQQIAGILKMGKTATDAATKVKTFTQLVDTLQEALGSGWAQTWQILFGGFNEARELFTDVSNVLGGFIQANSDARNKVLGDWKEMGGRTVLIEGIGNVFKALVELVKPIRDAFRDIFPATTGKTLYDLTVRFTEFTKGLKIGADTADGIRRTFKGFFAVLSIGWQIIKGVAGVIGTLIGALVGSSGGFLEFTGGIGDFLAGVDKALKEGGALAAFFEGLGSILAIPVKILGGLGTLLGGLFTGFDNGKVAGAADSFGRLGGALSPLDRIMHRVADAWAWITDAFNASVDFLSPAIEKIAESFGGMGEALEGSLGPGEFNGVLDLINTGLLGGILLLIRRFFKEGLNIDFGGGLIEGITDTFGALTDTLKAMQTQIQAKTLLLIAGAIAILTASVVTLSLIDSKALTKALSAMTVAFAQLLVAMGVLIKLSGSAGIIAVPAVAAAMVLLASAILVLSAAVKSLSELSWSELLKGLAGVGGLLAMLSVAAGPLTAVSGGLLRTGTGLIGLAIAIKILASAVEDFSSLSWGDMAKGLIGVASALGILVGAMYVIPPNILGTAAALLLLGGALKAIASAIVKMGEQSWGEVAKGLVSLAGSLAIIAGAMYLFPPNMLMTAAGLVLVASALKSIATAMDTMGDASWSEIAKGLVTLGGALWIISAGLAAMTGTLAGSAALFVAAAALGMLTPVLTTLGAMSWESILKGLAGLAGTLTILGVAGYLLGPVIPVLLGLGAAVALLGVGIAALGAGAMLLATAFTTVVAAGTAGITVMTAMSNAIINMIPRAMGAFGAGVVAFAVNIGAAGPALVKAMVAVIGAMLDAVVKLAPKMGKAFDALIDMATKAVNTNAPKIAEAGFNMLMAFLRQIDRNIYRITVIAISIVTKFIRAVGNNHQKMVDAGYKMIIKFINSVANTIRNNSDEMAEAGNNLGRAIVEGMVKGIAGGQSGVIGAALDIASAGLNAAKDFLGINSPSRAFMEVGKFSAQGMALGLESYSDEVERSASGVARTALDTIRMSMSQVGDAISTDMDLSPTITPVLDLTRMQQEASQIGGMLTPGAVRADISTQQATAISAERQSVSNVEEEAPEPVTKEVKFVQHNHSPKALSEIEIYRQTKNQLSLIANSGEV